MSHQIVSDRTCQKKIFASICSTTGYDKKFKNLTKRVILSFPVNNERVVARPFSLTCMIGDN